MRPCIISNFRVRTALAVLLAAVVVGVTVVAAMGDSLPVVSLKTIGLNYGLLKSWVDSNLWLSLAAYIAVYVSLAVLFLPGSSAMVVVSGLLFGPLAGLTLAWAASMLVAGLAFLVAGYLASPGFPADVAKGGTLERVRAGIARRAFSYMLFLRLSPGLPFAFVNAAAAVLGVPFATFLLASAIGFIPSRIALSTAGAGLASVIGARNDAYLRCLAESDTVGAACPYTISLASLLTAEIAAAFLALAVLALVPAFIDWAPALRRFTGSTQDVEGKPAKDR